MAATKTQTEIKERPILFSGEMVRAILDGRKTMTRRVVKPQIKPWEPNPLFLVWKDCVPLTLDLLADECPFGRVGDRLWVRETWQYKATNESLINPAVWFAADFNTPKEAAKSLGFKWKPSIFMPREASRITLEITDVRVERLQDISGRDVAREGVELERWKLDDDELPIIDLGVEREGEILRKKFSQLWDSINEKRGFGWNSNPFVWVISFKKID